MVEKEQVYRNLQRHLDRQAVGYPATKSGADIRLLKHFFTPEEARLAMGLSYRPRSPERIFEESRESGRSFQEMEGLLEGMMKKGVIGYVEKEGARFFFNLPLVVGMYEGQLNRITPEFLSDFDAYTSDRAFGLNFLSTELPQMRTIPVQRSIRPEHHVATYDHLAHLIAETAGPYVINECICRKSAELKGNPCGKTSRLETCMALGDTAKHCIKAGVGREITREEALDIAGLNEADGLVLQPSNAQRAEFICACCGCCCGMLRMHRALPRPTDFWSTNYLASVDEETCTGCGTCAERCQVDAVAVDKESGVSIVDRNRCIGCGNCVSTCPEEAITLVKKEKETPPPETREHLYDTIMAKKKGKLGKAKLAIRLMLKR